MAAALHVVKTSEFNGSEVHAGVMCVKENTFFVSEIMESCGIFKWAAQLS